MGKKKVSLCTYTRYTARGGHIHMDKNGKRAAAADNTIKWGLSVSPGFSSLVYDSLPIAHTPVNYTIGKIVKREFIFFYLLFALLELHNFRL